MFTKKRKEKKMHKMESDEESRMYDCCREKLICYIGSRSGSRKWQPTPVFLPGKSRGDRSLVESQNSHTQLGD